MCRGSGRVSPTPDDFGNWATYGRAPKKFFSNPMGTTHPALPPIDMSGNFPAELSAVSPSNISPDH